MHKTMPRTVNERFPKRLPRSWGFERYSLSLDGVDDYIEVPDDPSLDVGNELTIISWFKPREMDIFHPLVMRGVWTPDSYYYRIRDDNHFQLQLSIGGNTYGYYSSWVLSSDQLGNWLFIAVTYNNGNIFLRVNEYTETGSMEAGNIDDGGTLDIGWQPGPDQYAHGDICEVLIYNRALAGGEISHNMLEYHNPVRDGLIAWWPMEEGTGDTAKDYSGNNNDGTLYGPTWQRVTQYELRAEAGL